MRSRLRAEAPTRPYRIRLSPAEADRLKAAAAVNRQTLGAFLRDAGQEAASDCLDDDASRRRSVTR